MMQARWPEIKILCATRSACARLHSKARLAESDGSGFETDMGGLSVEDAVVAVSRSAFYGPGSPARWSSPVACFIKELEAGGRRKHH